MVEMHAADSICNYVYLQLNTKTMGRKKAGKFARYAIEKTLRGVLPPLWRKAVAELSSLSILVAQCDEKFNKRELMSMSS